MYDPELYRERSEVDEWKRRDPLTLLGGRLREAGGLDDAVEADLEAEVAAEIDAAVASAEAGTWEPVQDLTRFVTSEVAAS
jgi:TPP-dependent pyruvate/acetoin dehydrogenase alpha subunit